MSRFEEILKGKRARKATSLPLPLGTDPSTPKPFVDLIVLSGTEEASALAAATDFARSNGVTDPKPGDPHYDLGIMVHTLVRACVDHDEPGSFAFYFCPANDPENFEKAAQALLDSYDREAIVYLHQLQAVWQDECSPWGKAATEDEILAKMQELRGVADPSVPFVHMRPATVGSLLLSLVNRLFLLIPDKSPDGSRSASSTTSKTRNGDS